MWRRRDRESCATALITKVCLVIDKASCSAEHAASVAAVVDVLLAPFMLARGSASVARVGTANLWTDG